jgi:hypothetical protein
LGVAGYSGTPLASKLGIKAGDRVLVLNAPHGFSIPELPAGVRVGQAARGTAHVILSFHLARRDLERRVPKLRELMQPVCRLWISWPKRASGVQTDLTEDVVREIALANRLVDNKVAAIDDVWSGLQLVIRLADR